MEGCDRLIVVINVIFVDFFCILIVIYIFYFKEVF